ncbi:hypothetical protein F5141DRAFT_1138423 [Pisolithus sp. B1]|nr:hypothetical protein F5141DRAFT_1138423 [Pisolithus sp. B1]
MPVNSSYYPLPNGANAHPPRSPPPFNRPFKMSHSPQPSVGDEQSDSMLNPGVVMGGGTMDNEPTRHPDLWFCDGSIVLRAENTLFRVHKSLLARHSGFFHDLFTLPQLVAKDPSPPRVISTPDVDHAGDVEGCQVLALHDVAEDVANLLTALVDGPNFGQNDPTDFQVVSGILRLSTKYLVDALREKALNHLALAWPTTLKGWDAREDIARAQELRDGSAAVRIYPSPIAVINLAREVNAPALLPSAFYDLSRYHFTQIFDYGESFDESAWRFPLSTADMQRLALGKEASQHAVTTLIRSMGSLTHSLHGHPLGFHSHTHGHIHRTCKRDFAELVALATQHYLFDHERGCMDPLYVAEELGQPLYDLGQPMAADDYRNFGASRRGIEQAECQACARGLELWAARERERMWKMIPLWFRLDV